MRELYERALLLFAFDFSLKLRRDWAGELYVLKLELNANSCEHSEPNGEFEIAQPRSCGESKCTTKIAFEENIRNREFTTSCKYLCSYEIFRIHLLNVHNISESPLEHKRRYNSVSVHIAWHAGCLNSASGAITLIA